MKTWIFMFRKKEKYVLYTSVLYIIYIIFMSIISLSNNCIKLQWNSTLPIFFIVCTYCNLEIGWLDWYRLTCSKKGREYLWFYKKLQNAFFLNVYLESQNALKSVFDKCHDGWNQAKIFHTDKYEYKRIFIEIQDSENHKWNSANFYYIKIYFKMFFLALRYRLIVLKWIMKIIYKHFSKFEWHWMLI